MKQTSLMLRSPIFRMSFPHVIEPRAFIDPKNPGIKGDPTYSVEMIFQPDDLKNFQMRTDSDWEQVDIVAVMADVAKEKWPGIDLREEVRNKVLLWPVIDGNKKAQDREQAGKDASEVYQDMKVIKAKAKQDYPPSLAVIDKGKIAELDRHTEKEMATAKGLFVAGYYAKASLNMKAHEVTGKKYITFYLNGILYFKKGERIGGMSIEDKFGGIEGGESAYDPTANTESVQDQFDEEIPF